MNRTFATLPVDLGVRYVHRTPQSVIVFPRVAFGIARVAAAVALFATWDYKRWDSRTLIVAAAGLFIFIAIYLPLWVKTPMFVASERGIHFPCNELLGMTLGRSVPTRWLLAPWDRICNVRVAKWVDLEGSASVCVAFDLEVSRDEKTDFFRYVPSPVDRSANLDRSLPVPYVDLSAAPQSVELLREIQRSPPA